MTDQEIGYLSRTPLYSYTGHRYSYYGTVSKANTRTDTLLVFYTSEACMRFGKYMAYNRAIRKVMQYGPTEKLSAEQGTENSPKLTWGQEVVRPLFHVANCDVESRTNHAALKQVIAVHTVYIKSAINFCRWVNDMARNGFEYNKNGCEHLRKYNTETDMLWMLYIGYPAFFCEKHAMFNLCRQKKMSPQLPNLDFRGRNYTINRFGQVFQPTEWGESWKHTHLAGGGYKELP